MHPLRLSVLLCLLGTVGCNHRITPDTPRLVPDVKLIDKTFYSSAIARPVHLRIIVPKDPVPNMVLPVVYLLHGAGADYRDWSNRSNVAAFAGKNIVLVMPDAESSYYINEANGRNRRYEDYIVDDVVPEVRRTVPYAATDRAHNAIVGISRGGYGAAVIALKHPGLFSFAGDISGAVDFAERPLRWHSPLESLGNRRVFGPVGSATRRANDPLLLIRGIPSAEEPHWFVACGKEDVLLSTNRTFFKAISQQTSDAEFHTISGGHNWDTWNAILPSLETSLLHHFHQTDKHVL